MGIGASGLRFEGGEGRRESLAHFSGIRFRGHGFGRRVLVLGLMV